MKITAAIITLNEAENIRAACNSVAWADEIVVVDSHSTDATRAIAAECGARVINREWPGFAQQKQFATDQTSHDWVFSLDADERVSDELKASIQRLRQISEEQLADGYSISRRSFYMGRWICGGGWYPDRQLRLFRKASGSWEGAHIPESVKMKPGARTETFPGDILHYPGRNESLFVIASLGRSPTQALHFHCYRLFRRYHRQFSKRRYSSPAPRGVDSFS